MFENLWGWFVAASGTSGILGVLAGRFFRTREQKGSDAAEMIAKVSDAFEKTLATTMKYSSDVIEKMRTDEEKSDVRYHALEERFSKLEERFFESENDRELLKGIVGDAAACKFLKSGRNEECPVIRGNIKRLKARCKKCETTPKNEQP